MTKERDRVEVRLEYLRNAEDNWNYFYGNSKNPQEIGEAMLLLNVAEQKYLNEVHIKKSIEIKYMSVDNYCIEDKMIEEKRLCFLTAVNELISLSKEY